MPHKTLFLRSGPYFQWKLEVSHLRFLDKRKVLLNIALLSDICTYVPCAKNEWISGFDSVTCRKTQVVHSTLNLRSTLYVSTSWNEWNCGFRLPIYISWKCSITLCIWDLYSWNYEEAGCCHKTPFSSLGTTIEKMNEMNEKTTEFLVFRIY